MHDHEAPPPGNEPQSADTSFESERILIAAYRRMPPWEKARRLTELARAVEELARCGLRERHPDAAEDELRLRLGALRIDPETMARVFHWDPAREGY